MSSIPRLADLALALKGRVAANTVPDPAGPRFFGIAEISTRGSSPPRYVPEDECPDDAVVLAEGDVVMALLGNIGNATVIPDTAVGFVLGRECVALRVTAPELLCPAWLCAWTESEEFRAQAAQHITGTTMPRLSTRALENFAITLPPVAKQLELAELVRRFDNAIAATATTLQQLEGLRAAEMQLAIAHLQAQP